MPPALLRSTRPSGLGMGWSLGAVELEGVLSQRSPRSALVSISPSAAAGQPAAWHDTEMHREASHNAR
jgi:hypothetical protein